MAFGRSCDVLGRSWTVLAGLGAALGSLPNMNNCYEISQWLSEIPGCLGKVLGGSWESLGVVVRVVVCSLVISDGSSRS